MKNIIALRSIQKEDLSFLSKTSLAYMTNEQKNEMILSSLNKSFQGEYFEEFVIIYEEVLVGIIGLCSHGGNIIGCSPEILPSYRQRGFGFEAEKQALRLAKEQGYSVVVAHIQKSNIASIKLHKKLGFDKYDSNKKSNANETDLYILVL